MTISLSQRVRALAQERAREQGFESVDAYVNALIQEDRSAKIVKEWMHARINEGLRSPNAGRLTKKKLHRLVSEGIARASRRA